VSDPIRAETAERVLERLGFAARPPNTLEGLNALYGAWCRGVPFDNVRKRIALLTRDPAPLPGAYAEEFLQAWLRHGTGGTCWPSSNGLFALFDWCGFDVRRIAGSMHDVGDANHGSVVARIEGTDFMVDSSMHTDAAFPLRRGEETRLGDPLHPVRVEPVGDSFRVHWALPASEAPSFVCRLLDDPVDHVFYLERYDVTRTPDRSPFNLSLYARRDQDGVVLSYLGRTRFRKTAEGVEPEELEPDDLARSLVEELRLSEEIVAELRKHDGLE
jgi:N-hydroxyarylamine O-acetyltransferase